MFIPKDKRLYLPIHLSVKLTCTVTYIIMQYYYWTGPAVSYEIIRYLYNCFNCARFWTLRDLNACEGSTSYRAILPYATDLVLGLQQLSVCSRT